MKIGVFDSGLGGLTVLRAIMELVRGAKIFYVADTLYAPYGEKSFDAILKRSLTITQYLIEQYQINALVVACNTATSAAIKQLRQRYPHLIIIGTEPAIKPAIEQTKTGAIGVMATPATLKGDKYQSLVDRVASDKAVTLYEQACAGLVEHIEHNTLDSYESQLLLEEWLKPMREGGVDIIVLGCTHYPLAGEAIKKILNREVTLIDSGDAIAHYLLHQLHARGHANQGELKIDIFHTGEIDTDLVDRILGEHYGVARVEV